ncbi:MAG TPA: asparagine synthase (glutamine-hydrolyzing), partial [Gammaproteobacteria bacterium]|nr:asparagine synthase (glutamine-hydrolyzing) [Gammaproteobacteria bacterium]
MCGITGILSTGPKPDIRRMTDALTHRGPDGVGYYEDAAAALGHRRLSIIDIEGGHQPLSNEDGTLLLVCNGEIYNSPGLRDMLLQKNHVFRTTTDVEVILHLYEEHGPACVGMLRGMFAFAIWDTRKRSLFLGRDHLGQKPLFYSQVGDDFIFASEVKALFASGRIRPQLDLEGLWHYMSLRLVPGLNTLFSGVRKLPAASTLTFQDGMLEIDRYWRPDFLQKRQEKAHDLVEELHALLQETVGMHLLSDVRVGAFISGGIDSTLIAALAASASGEPLPVFSLGVDEAGFNEVPQARLVADRYGMEMHDLTVRPNLIELVPEMIVHMDEPADPYGAGIYQVSKLASRHVKVALSGDGGDESFAGYDRYLGQRLVDYYCALPAPLRKGVFDRLLGSVPETFAYKSLAQKAAWLRHMSTFSDADRYLESLTFLRFTHEAKQQLFTAGVRRQVADANSGDEVLAEFRSQHATEAVDRMLFTDLMIRVPNLNLQIGDRMSMAHSLEVRCPFMDHVLVEFAASLPASLKLRHMRLKYMLRTVGERYLPREILRARKQGFGFPLGPWMRSGQLNGFIRGVLGQSVMVRAGIFSADAIGRLVDEHTDGRVDHNYRLWLLANVELWYRLNFEGQTR